MQKNFLRIRAAHMNFRLIEISTLEESPLLRFLYRKNPICLFLVIYLDTISALKEIIIQSHQILLFVI